MIAFNSTYFYLIVCYAHMKIFLLHIRNTSFTFIYFYYYYYYYYYFIRL